MGRLEELPVELPNAMALICVGDSVSSSIRTLHGPLNRIEVTIDGSVFVFHIFF